MVKTTYGGIPAEDPVGWAIGGGCVRHRHACGGRDDVWYAGVSFEVEAGDEIFRVARPVDPLYYSGF